MVNKSKNTKTYKAEGDLPSEFEILGDIIGTAMVAELLDVTASIADLDERLFPSLQQVVHEVRLADEEAAQESLRQRLADQAVNSWYQQVASQADEEAAQERRQQRLRRQRRRELKARELKRKELAELRAERAAGGLQYLQRAASDIDDETRRWLGEGVFVPGSTGNVRLESDWDEEVDNS